ncbi:MAG: desulfoferrodoxin [Candidatus Heimdallarchaeota archaeon]|nr:desulfoferrodoxin [Candidatus Heimdallarchaeota archaeon]
MTEQNEIYKCDICGNVVSVIETGAGELVCCGQPMKLLEEKTSEQEGNEKHVPVIETIEGGVRVKIGSVPHPMEEDHHIELIQLVKENNIMIGKRLKPGDEPAADFCCIADAEGLTARALCNKHGLWKN